MWQVKNDFQVENWCDDAASRSKKKNGKLLPDNIRALIVGPSGCGKTNLLLSLLTHPDGLRFENVYIYSKTLFQPKYKLLQEILQDLIPCRMFTQSEDVPDPNDVESNTVIVFDDCASENQNQIRKYFAFGRHMGIDSFYLSQTFAQIPKHQIRDNACLIIAFRQDEVNLRHIYHAYVGGDMSLNLFKELCRAAWNHSPFSFLVIDRTRPLNEGRYSRNFNEVYG